MQGIQILSVTFILIMLYTVRIHSKKNELPKVEAIIWTIGLVVLGIIVSFKGTADIVRNLFSVTRLLDVLVIIALMGTFILLIENRIQINKLRQKLDRLVRDRAMEAK
ncbi:MAG: hypothetical protein ACD_40C00213G0056 [uncultured bacterium]|nr:MAG: hypothetical protein ACD_40C00213G0056 [uncultured bacterium]KKU14795.1 MAG: hypothetical protein UX21_C0010G0003 [Microgenomates group bacterium GW2011_GWC2_45_8]KKU26236.1 MAG: hypothetical protein UX37_C0004G0031 [Microgenomates group bacterium GW2011_GWA2_46_16]